MKKYTAAYLDDNKNILNLQESLKSMEDSKISKIYSSPTLESIEEQVQVAKLQNCDTLNFLMSQVSDKEGLEEDLNEAYGFYFDGGIHLLPLDEADETVTPQSLQNSQPVQNVQTVQNIQNSNPEAPSNINNTAKLNVDSKPNMIIFNPFGTLSFDKDGNLNASVIKYIDLALKFINKYSDKCRAIYFIDSRIDNPRAVQPDATLAINYSWISANAIIHPEYKNLEDFFFYTEVPERFNNQIVIRDTYKNKGDFSKIRVAHSYIFMDKAMYTALNSTELRGFTTTLYNLVSSDESFENFASNKKFEPGIQVDVLLPTENELVKSLSDVKSDIDTILMEGVSEDEQTLASVKTDSVEYYLGLLIQSVYNNSKIAASIDASRRGVIISSNSTGNKFSSDKMYKTQKLDRIDRDNYWSNNSQVEDDDEYKKAARKNIDKYLLNKEVDGDKFTDKTLEKIYNLKYLPKDFLGLSNGDEVERFDYRRYNSEDKRIPGVSGIQVYKLEKRKNEIAKEIDDINLQIEELDDEDYDDSEKIKQLNKKLVELSDEDENIDATLDAAKRSSDANEKISKITKDTAQDIENGNYEELEDNSELTLSKKKAYYRLVFSEKGENMVKQLKISLR